jgi:two-component system sensor histidine kinase DegS
VADEHGTPQERHPAELVAELDIGLDRASAAERRIVRLGFDLHDGPLQHLAALISDIRLFARQLAGVVPGDAPIVGRVADIEARAVAAEEELRGFASSLTSIDDLPLDEVLRTQVERFSEDTGIAVTADVVGAFDDLSDSQRIAVARVLQGALANVRQHSGAHEVRVRLMRDDDGTELRVRDDGCGFDVDEALERAPARHRLGLIAMTERIRLLDGSFSVESRRGGPTEVVARLPEWRHRHHDPSLD